MYSNSVKENITESTHIFWIYTSSLTKCVLTGLIYCIIYGCISKKKLYFWSIVKIRNRNLRFEILEIKWNHVL